MVYLRILLIISTTLLPNFILGKDVTCLDKFLFILSGEKGDMGSALQRASRFEIHDLPASLQKTVKKVVVKVKNKNQKEVYLVGKLSKEMDLSEYSYYLLDDGRSIHILDANSNQLEFYKFNSDFNDESFKKLRIAYSRSKGMAVVDEKKLRKAVCPKLKLISETPQYQAIERALEKNPEKALLRSVRALYGAGCANSFIYVYPMMLVYDFTDENFRGKGGLKGWIGDHDSNFLGGFYYMGIMDQCLKTIAPTKAKEILKLTLGADILMNIHFEVYMGMDKSPLGNNKIRNDFSDLSTGLAAATIYAALSKSYDNLSFVKNKRLCN